jgi:tetratricopeptide (TPR) repeat protein
MNGLHRMQPPQGRPPRGRAGAHALECAVRLLIDGGQHALARELLERARADPTPDLLLASAQCHFHERQWERALEVALRCARLGWELPELLILKGRCLFNLAEYGRALAALARADRACASDLTRLWVARCRVCCASAAGAGAGAAALPALAFDARPAPAPEWRHDCYHSATHVVLTLYVAGLAEDQIEVAFEARRVTVRIALREPAVLRFRLEQPIVPALSRYRIGATKVEIKMAKASPGPKQWHVQPEQ